MRARLSPLAALIALLVALLPSASWAQSLTLWHAYRDDERAALDQIIDAYRRAHPGVTVDEVVEATGFELQVPDDVPTSRGPEGTEVEELERIDPGGLRFSEVPDA